MLPTIQLDNQIRVDTSKIRDGRIDLVLAAKFPSRQLPVAQVSPHQTLGIRLCGTQDSDMGDIGAFHDFPSTQPSPARGEEETSTTSAAGSRRL